MAVVNDITINSLIQQRDALIKNFEIHKTIKEDEYKKKIYEINFKIKERNDYWIKQEQERINNLVKDESFVQKNFIKQINIAVTQQKVKKEPIVITQQKVKKERQKRTGVSLRSTIIKVLCSGKVKSHDDVIKEVKKILPNIEDKKILYFSKYTIFCTKKKDPRYTKFAWDDNKFLLINV